MSKFPFFSVVGIEIEYMLVHQQTLQIQSLSDIILHSLAGKQVNEVALGDISVSNELVLHVLELKNNGPKQITDPIADQFQQTIDYLQPLLHDYSLKLLPTGAHPWMDPYTETKRWPHDNAELYQQYHTIFNCQGHGWSNLQSMHINLPFTNDEEFKQLHNAIRLLLPLLPALCASTPFLNGKKTGVKDSRLEFYGKNQQRIPIISGDIIPEFIQTEAEYRNKVLQPMYDAIHPFDPRGLLQYEWLNSRGAIPKFDCGAIEIRIIDPQECTNADIAIAKTVFLLLKKLITTTNAYLESPCSTFQLKQLYDQSIKAGFAGSIDDQVFISQWGLPFKQQSYCQIWSKLIAGIASDLDFTSQTILESILSQGNLSERLLRAYDKQPSANLQNIYQQLSECLRCNRLFL